MYEGHLVLGMNKISIVSACGSKLSQLSIRHISHILLSLDLFHWNKQNLLQARSDVVYSS